MVEEIINKALGLLSEGDVVKCRQVLLENLHLFSKEAQVKILSSFIESEIRKEIYKIENIVSVLKDIVEESKKDLSH